MGVQIRCGGWWVSSIAGWGELTWSHAADGGCKEASWRMDLPPTFSHSALTRGAIVEIRYGSENVWQGVLLEPNMDNQWTFTAQGLSVLGADYLCFDSGGNTTSVPDTAFDQAVSRGLPWARSASISSSPVSATSSTDGLNYLGDLMTAYATNAGQRWGVDAKGTIYCVADPTTPTWYLTPGSGRFGLADDDYASDLYGRYLAPNAGFATISVADTTARSNKGRREFGADLTPLGLISSTAATAVLNGLLARGKSRLGYANGLTATQWQLTTEGGSPACLAYVTGGQMVRMFGVVNEQGQPLPYLDWVIGETAYDAGSNSIGLTPVGLAARTLADVFTVLT